MGNHQRDLSALPIRQVPVSPEEFDIFGSSRGAGTEYAVTACILALFRVDDPGEFVPQG